MRSFLLFLSISECQKCCDSTSYPKIFFLFCWKFNIHHKVSAMSCCGQGSWPAYNFVQRTVV